MSDFNSSLIIKNEDGTVDNRFLFDYLTVTFKTVTPRFLLEQFCDLVSNKDIVFDAFDLKDSSFFRGYNASYNFANDKYITISWRVFDSMSYNGLDYVEDSAVTLNLSGVGCRFLTELDFYNLFFLIDKLGGKITRLDICYDDFNHCIPYDRMINSVMDFMKTSQSIASYSQSSSTQIFVVAADINKKRYVAQNFTVGKRTSDSFIRLYDKLIETKCKELEYWKRFEIQLKNKRAFAFVENYKKFKNFSKCFIITLNDVIRFVSVKNYNSTVLINETWWDNFIADLRNCRYISQIYILGNVGFIFFKIIPS